MDTFPEVKLLGQRVYVFLVLLAIAKMPCIKVVNWCGFYSRQGMEAGGCPSSPTQLWASFRADSVHWSYELKESPPWKNDAGVPNPDHLPKAFVTNSLRGVMWGEFNQLWSLSSPQWTYLTLHTIQRCLVESKCLRWHLTLPSVLTEGVTEHI